MDHGRNGDDGDTRVDDQEGKASWGGQLAQIPEAAYGLAGGSFPAPFDAATSQNC